MRDDATKLPEVGGKGESSEHARLVNLTPHHVVLEAPTGNGGVERLVLPPADEAPRLVIAAGEREIALVRDGEEDACEIAIPIVNGTRITGIEPSLPDPQPGVLYITSRALAEYNPERRDLVWPEDQVRDDEGRVLAARGLGRIGSPGL